MEKSYYRYGLVTLVTLTTFDKSSANGLVALLGHVFYSALGLPLILLISCSLKVDNMIAQLKDKVLVASFETAAEASIKTGISAEGIRRCLRAEQTRAGNYSWQKYEPAILKLNGHQLYDRYKTLAEASSATGVAPSIIHRALSGEQKQGGGHLWEYEAVVLGSGMNPSFDIYAADIKQTKSLRKVDLAWVQKYVLSPDKATRETFTRIAIAELMHEWAEKKQLKERLNFITPCVATDGKRRRYSNIQNFTGLAHLDFDHIENAPEFRDYLFEEHPYVVGAWLSPSQKAVKAIARIPITHSVPEFKEYFWGLHAIMNMYVGFDTAPQNPVLPLFLSHDPDAKFRTSPSVFQLRGTNPSHDSREPIQIKKDFSTFEQHVILDRISKRIDAIEDNGHPQLRATAYTLGGFVGAGYVDYNDALDTITEVILRNDYLSKGTDGYCLTAKQMIKAGMKAPLDL